MKGTIKKIMQDRGFGFISVDDNSDDDIFFHQTNLKDVELSRLRMGQEVEFEVEETPKGPNAVNITVVE